MTGGPFSAPAVLQFNPGKITGGIQTRSRLLTSAAHLPAALCPCSSRTLNVNTKNGSKKSKENSQIQSPFCNPDANINSKHSKEKKSKTKKKNKSTKVSPTSLPAKDSNINNDTTPKAKKPMW
ncbi:hypothetical protein PGT21_035856 [Puccinia graminis f. sp. tritici]|uniref:Uncharacterized protein n=1 Tax=Puccinia graminis f. sp. tritici TaxID=56615 RepID=A0A5B0NEF0_PUCGR|nr:hypothetical protein PGT21_035856 [Puccinia graminis f. sp. tritici]